MNKPPSFTEGPKCFQCNVSFTVFKRRHHCRNCGNAFCGNCQKKTVAIPKFGFNEEVRVCDACYDSLQHESIKEPESVKKTVSKSNNEPKIENAEPLPSPQSIKRVKNCKCNMPLCICPPDPEPEKAKEKPIKKTEHKVNVNEEPQRAPTSWRTSIVSSYLYHGDTQVLNEECRRAVKNGDLYAVKKLLESGASINYTDNQKSTFLHMACLFDHSEIAEFLLKKGCSPTAANASKETPIDLAPPALAYRMQELIKN